MPNFFEILQLYLVPFAIAIPVVLLIFFFSMRKPDSPKIDDIAPEPEQPALPIWSADSTVRVNSAIDLRLDEPAGSQADSRAGPDTVITEVDIALDTPASLLVVDDSAVPRTKLRRLFESHGYRVEVAGDGVEALEAMARARFDLVITDLEMPNMDGFELIAAIQGSLETEHIPVIAITGHEALSARVHDISGLYGIFKKPWNDRELLRRVETLCSLRKKTGT